jgi:hypothetical protein
MHPNAREYLDERLAAARRAASQPGWDSERATRWNALSNASIEALKTVGAISDFEATDWLESMRLVTGASPPERYSSSQRASGGADGRARARAASDDVVRPARDVPQFVRANPGLTHTFHLADTDAWITTVELYDVRLILNVRLVRSGEAPTATAGERDSPSWFGNPTTGLLAGLVVRDDIGTAYSQRGSGGWGSKTEAKFDARFIPAVPDEASELIIEWAGVTATVDIPNAPS